MELIIESRTHGGQVVLIDDWLWPFIKHWKWGINKKGSGFYCERKALVDGKERHIQLSRFILGITDRKTLVDHKNHNTLDNRCNNIRACTNSQNQCNRRRVPGRRLSAYKGVNVCNKNGVKMYRPAISINGKVKHLGRFPLTPCGELCAALAYDRVAIELHVDFACLNFQ